MIYQDAQLARQLTPHLKRVLVLDASAPSARLLNELLRDLGALQISAQPTNVLAQGILSRFDPQVVFTEFHGPGVDGLDFTRALRRSVLACRQVPVIMITAEATAAAILASRHAGVHEFLRKPYTIKDLMRRLDAALLRPRDWIEAVRYIGPDRRRFNSGDYVGPRKRLSDNPPASDKDRIIQALKILRAAIPAIDTDPVQALRSMRAQADELHRTAIAGSDVKLMAAVSGLGRCLTAAIAGGGLSRSEIEASVEDLWPYLPVEADEKPMLQAI